MVLGDWLDHLVELITKGLLIRTLGYSSECYKLVNTRHAGRCAKWENMKNSIALWWISTIVVHFNHGRSPARGDAT
jgi:hypothetical protein